MKGIVLAGGSGTRLYPVTRGVNKHLLNVYDKPMIYYPLSTLMIAGIKEILIMTTPEDIGIYRDLLGDGESLGICLKYQIQVKPEGLAQSFSIAQNFIGKDSVCLILGDNIFYGHGLSKLLVKGILNAQENKYATVYGYYVNDPERYGVVTFDNNGKVLSLEEKPKKPNTNYAIVGLYFYPNDVIEKSKKVKKSDRGEFEITSVNQDYLNEERLKVETMGRGFAWLDTGTHKSLLEAGQFVYSIENRQSLKIACLEEIAYEKGYISREQLLDLAKPLSKTDYGKYLVSRARQGKIYGVS
ncbi:glucose-1-phosphate thymidylyltransferase [Francisella halioticida]|uniref:glucose-1-phosphate thymidylyltransferase RfbA n=1 Tax=Francisella halioticida TaxID=549298 RepID=UPI001AF8FCDB|nr:glucose-1-phosphate thymidylyltransferase RfbA [Francisella halioticida]BCD91412.1 glucose-1-phosphate thymidylyltransferase [Francisella halioticida]